MKNTLRNTLLISYLVGPTSSMASDWSAATHFGYAVVDRSTTGFKSVQGSMLFFDVYRNIGDMAFGMRTVTQGGKGNSQEFYRLGTGPVVKWTHETWTVHGSLGLFKETGLDHQGDAHYQSSGQNYLIGWQRSRAITKSAALTWGSFFTGHQGQLTPASASFTSPNRTNTGLSHGIEISIRMGL